MNHIRSWAVAFGTMYGCIRPPESYIYAIYVWADTR